MDSIVEVQRQTHEELERFERALYTILSRPQPTHESQIKNAHTAAQILERTDSRVGSLNALYLDDNARNAELEALAAGGNNGGVDDLGEFYKRLERIQEHYAKYPEAATIGGGFELELAALLEEGNEDYEEYEEEDRACFSLRFVASVTWNADNESLRSYSRLFVILRRRSVRKIPGLVYEPHCVQQHEECWQETGVPPVSRHPASGTRRSLASRVGKGGTVLERI
jgi:hypothetical protein